MKSETVEWGFIQNILEAVNFLTLNYENVLSRGRQKENAWNPN